MKSAARGVAFYSYDGDGRRVEKVVGSVATVYVYDAGGRLVAEYGGVQSQTSRASYVTQDALGSTRAVTGQSQEVRGRYDYLPFGEEVYAGREGYGGGEVRQRFTGYEQDEETGLNFAKARYQSPMTGRFISPDPYGPWAMAEGEKVAFLASPQQWNRYAYVMNNPLRLKDPTGLEIYDPDSVSEENQTRIHHALVQISKNGTAKQRKIANFILKNDVLISVVASGSAFDGDTVVNDSSAANADIAKGWVSMERAASYVGIKINAFQLADTPERTASLEGVLVHEGRHAYGIARTISTLSAREGADKVFNPTRFRDENDAYTNEANYLQKQGGVYHQVGLGTTGTNYDLLKKDGDTIKVNSERIKQIIKTGYGVSEQDQGPATTERFNLKLPGQ